MLNVSRMQYAYTLYKLRFLVFTLLYRNSFFYSNWHSSYLNPQIFYAQSVQSQKTSQIDYSPNTIPVKWSHTLFPQQTFNKNQNFNVCKLT